MSNFWFVIPARKGSKRFPGKNRKLVPITIKSLDKKWKRKTIISTNDSQIAEFAKKSNIKVHNRSEKNSSDTASMKQTIREVIDDLKIKETDVIVCLYPTYPERSTESIEKILKFFKKEKVKSLLCKKQIDTNPYLCLIDVGNNKGKSFIDHDLYRSQDYPKFFQYSHFVAIFTVSELTNLNNQLYNSETIFYNIENMIDVDSENDYNQYVAAAKGSKK